MCSNLIDLTVNQSIQLENKFRSKGKKDGIHVDKYLLLCVMRLRVRYSLAITWMTILIHLDYFPSTESTSKPRIRKDVIERNLKTIGSLFNDHPINFGKISRDRRLFMRQLHNERIATTEVTPVSRASDSDQDTFALNKRVPETSLLAMSGPEILKDTDTFNDYEANKPLTRVKRIANSINPPSRAISTSERKSSTVDKEEGKKLLTNENDEGEYIVLEGDIDMSESHLNDEVFKKENHLEDVYPDVTNLSIQNQSYLEPSESSSKLRKLVKRKTFKDKDQGEMESEADADVDCANEYYYDDESEELSPKADKRASKSIFPLSDYESEDRETERKIEKRHKAPINSLAHTSRNTGNDLVTDSKANSNVEKDYLRFPGKDERLSASKHNTSSFLKTSKKLIQKKETSKFRKKSSEMKKRVPVKSKSDKKLTKEKIKSKHPKKKSKNDVHSKQNERSAETLSASKLASYDDGISEYVEGDINHEKLIQSEPVKISSCKNFIKEKNSNVNNNIFKTTRNFDGCVQGNYILHDLNKKESGGKSLVEKSSSVDKNQIMLKDKSSQTIGEVKNLLGTLIGQVANLQDLMYELKDFNEDRVHISDDSEPTSVIRRRRRRRHPGQSGLGGAIAA